MVKHRAVYGYLAVNANTLEASCWDTHYVPNLQDNMDKGRPFQKYYLTKPSLPYCEVCIAHIL